MSERLSISQKIDNWVRSGDRSIWDCYRGTSKKSCYTQGRVGSGLPNRVSCSRGGGGGTLGAPQDPRSRVLPIPRRFDRDQVLLIRSLYEIERFSYRDLAARFETCKATIAHVVKGKGAYKRC